jgi:hypothetical protein
MVGSTSVLQAAQRAFLIGTHQTAITGDIRRQDSR